MTEHKSITHTRESLREKLESRFTQLYHNDQYNGKYEEEFTFLENVLADQISEGADDSFKDETVLMQSCKSVLIADGVGTPVGEGGLCRPAGRFSRPPELLTGVLPCTHSPQNTLPLEDVPEYSHGGYDGGIEVGFDGTWNPLKFPKLLETLDEAKNRASEIQNGPEGVIIELGGEEILVMPTGAKVGGMLYKYRFMCRGVEFMIHHNPPKERQPIRVKYHAESLIGNHFFTVHEQFVVPFIKRLGLVVHAEKLSRIDMQVMLDVPVSEFFNLFLSGHIVKKMLRWAPFGKGERVETLHFGMGSDVSVVFYDKSREMRAHQKNIVKDTYFVERCIGDEWINSGRPITRVEIRLSRQALKSLGVNSVADLKEREHGIVDLITSEWFRILDKPKVRGHENTAALHPYWERIRNLFMTYFSGKEVDEVVWEKNKTVSCDPVALEKQALGCLSKALAVRFGEQASVRESLDLVGDWAERFREDLHEKLNSAAAYVRVYSGIELVSRASDSIGYDAELDDPRQSLAPSVLAARDERLKEWFAGEDAR